MKYYQVDLDVDVTGVKNGLYQIDIGLPLLEKDSRYDELLKFFKSSNTDFWQQQNEIKNIMSPAINAKLLKNANVTDVMGYTQNISFLNLVYSRKFIDIIKSFNIGNYNTFEVDIENVEEKYFMLFFETILSRDINFEHSSIYTGHKALNNVEYFNFFSYDEYWEFKQQNPLAKFEKICISKKHAELNIISIQPTSLLFYSEKLIDFLFDCKITGLEVNYNNSIQLEFV
ncbi:hypothetical protein [Flavobacterium lindanitolerans]|uniref:Uncharacterized protein n=1 Tax=Flavobacterium lindanitolerans TaxID=428988 RepID=A0A497V7F7_9FLAO|nr:hypothetical protein [Flavobacterium lindanitolerans]MBC8643233.1 hypothetical protein [Flavobacterium lindanitolerans]PKW29233.1 hypothetical protein B0G92_0864 [Flavobacterium lindanitolerans]RLJ35266.1 hypothetical protein CLV50_0641 [Flavobacterium lindanitolerans]